MTTNADQQELKVPNATAAPAKKKVSGTQDFLNRMGVLGEILSFFWKRRLFWLIPMLIVLGMVAIFIVIGISSPAGAFIYALF